MTTSCVLNAPRCVTTVPRVHLHGSRGGVFVGHRPPRDPGDPPHIYIYINIQKVIEVLHLYRCVTHTRGLLCREAFTQRIFLHTEGFTQRNLYSKELCTQTAWSFYTQKLLFREIFVQRALIYRSVYTQNIFRQRNF